MALQVQRLVNRPIDSNCFILYHQGESSCIIVDPGTADDKEILAFLQEQGLMPEYIILTHEHFDHIAGVNLLKDAYACSIVCSDSCSRKITDRKKNMSLFHDQVGFATYPADILVETIGYKLDWQGTCISFFATPGHTDSSISFSIAGKLFTGDCLIKGVKTVTKLPGGSKEALRKSFDHYKTQFNAAETRVYPGHGAVFILDEIDLNELL